MPPRSISTNRRPIRSDDVSRDLCIKADWPTSGIYIRLGSRLFSSINRLVRKTSFPFFAPKFDDGTFIVLQIVAFSLLKLSPHIYSPCIFIEKNVQLFKSTPCPVPPQLLLSPGNHILNDYKTDTKRLEGVSFKNIFL